MPPSNRSSVDAAAQAAVHDHDELEKKCHFDLRHIALPPGRPAYVAVTKCSDVLALDVIFAESSVVFAEQLSRQPPSNAEDFARIATGQTGTVYYIPQLDESRQSEALKEATVAFWEVSIDGTTQVRWYVTNKTSPARLHNHRVFSTEWSRHYPGDDLYEQHVKELRTLIDHPYIRPDAVAFTDAQAQTDWSCFIEDPDTAWDRVMNTPYIYHNAKEPFRDMTNDRYLLELEPAKRLLASIVHMSAAQYLLFKRKYFKAFYRDLVFGREKIPIPVRTARQSRSAEAAAQSRRDQQFVAPHARADAAQSSTPAPPDTIAASSQDMPPSSAGFAQHLPRDNSPAFCTRSHVPIDERVTGAEAARQMLRAEEEASTIATSRATPQRGLRAMQVRSDKNHIDAIRALLGFTWTNARLIQEGWKAMGLLNEENYVDWLDGGGQLETIGLWEY